MNHVQLSRAQIEFFVDKVVKDYPQELQKYRSPAKREFVLLFLEGVATGLCKNRADPDLLNTVLREKLDKSILVSNKDNKTRKDGRRRQEAKAGIGVEEEEHRSGQEEEEEKKELGRDGPLQWAAAAKLAVLSARLCAAIWASAGAYDAFLLLQWESGAALLLEGCVAAGFSA
ncbi:hypothetical protein DM860_013454 [Cuscuta australis]|uniref:Uncharacterized protein n=1 Tax=Cuscuta australis TaxID=267555 RepID=A0A328D4C2_9ASTE|nr:hypothetical protein DM860_013454 [Cuscuta australis]